MTALDQLRAQLAAAQARCERLLAIRRNLPATANRARTTTARSRWFHACEERDAIVVQLELVDVLGVVTAPRTVAASDKLLRVADGR